MDEQPKGTTICVLKHDGESDGQALARSFAGPELRHAQIASGYGLKWAEQAPEKPALMDLAEYVEKAGERGAQGDLALASRMLAAQALSLDQMFTELARRAALNLGTHLDAGERYARLALKAQANSRATMEALAKLHQPREQTVRHVHVNEGGQAIVADQFHHHAGGRNAGSAEQSHAPLPIGGGPPLPCEDARGDALPVPRRKGA